MGREEGGGENATPLEYLAPSKPCIALSKPAVGSLPWLAALLPSLPPLPVPEPSPESALSFLLGGWGVGSDPFLLREGTLGLGLQGPLLPSSVPRDKHNLKKTETVRLCVCSSPPGEAGPQPWGYTPSLPSTSPVERCRNQVPGAEGGRRKSGNLIFMLEVGLEFSGPTKGPRTRQE